MTSSSPAEAVVAGWRSDLSHIARLSRRARVDLLRAAIELAIARLTLSHVSPARLLAMRGDGASEPARAELVDRVAFAIPRVAARVPWRADCLVQALAARRWLKRAGVATSLTCGVRKDGEALSAHAWLSAGKRQVTGGDGGEYRAVEGPKA